MIKEEDGYSLVETLVALAILLAVLVPSAMFLGVIGSNTLAKDKIASFNLAKNAMEQALITQRDTSFIDNADDGNWLVKVSTDKETDHLYSIGVEVYREDTLRTPSVSLHTKRLWYDN